MYTLVKVKEKVRVPPKEFGGKLDETIRKIVQEEYEGIVDEDLGLVIAVIGVGEVGEGKVVLGDGAAYYRATLELLMYKPLMHEIVEGAITEVTEFGAFVRISPIEGLVHVSQIMDDYINYDAKLPGFIGKKTNKRLTIDDEVLARIVTISLKGNIQNSKIGLTMRQPFLGKESWVKKDSKQRKGTAKKDSEKKEAKEKKEKKEAKK